MSSAASDEGVSLQREYYARTAARYDDVHIDEEFGPALGIVMDCLERWSAGSVLDVGTGTGRLVRELRRRDRDLPVHGIDPVPELLAIARERFAVPEEMLSVADGASVPFADRSWDAVCAIGVLHHVPDPRAVVDEMLRVAGRMIVICDDNRFGHGTLPRRVSKLALHHLGLLSVAGRARRGGRAYRVSENDGISYAFSVYEILELVREWADEVIVHPVLGPTRGPLSKWHRLGAPGIVLCARRSSPPAPADPSSGGPIRVSVVIPSYRRPEPLARCLDGLARQDRAPDEVLVVARPDDAPTLDVVRAAPIPVHAVDVITPGLLGAMQAGAAAATGDIIAFTDDDAIPRPDWLRRLAEHFDDPTVGAVGGRDRIPGQLDGETEDVGRITSWGRLVGNHHLGIGQARTVDVLKGVNMAFRRAALALPRDLRGRGAQVHSEIAMCAWARAHGWGLVFDPQAVVDHLPATRVAGDERGYCARDVRDASFNLVLGIASLRSRLAWRRALYGLLVGDRLTPGLLRAAVATARGERDVVRVAPAAMYGQAEALVALARGRRQQMVPVAGATSDHD